MLVNNEELIWERKTKSNMTRSEWFVYVMHNGFFNLLRHTHRAAYEKMGIYSPCLAKVKTCHNQNVAT